MKRRRSRGFTIVELLVSIAVIAVLVSLVLPAIQKSRERARASQCLNNLKQIGMALHSYENLHQVLPPSFVRQEDGNPPPPPPQVAFSGLRYRGHWTGFHMLLPFIDEPVLYGQYDFTGTWLSSMTNANDHSCWALNQTRIRAYVCPSSPHQSNEIGSDGLTATTHWMGGSPTDYAFSHGADAIRALPGDEVGCAGGILGFWTIWPKQARGAFGYSSDCRIVHIRDGLSNTFVIGEKAGGLLTYSGWNSTFPTLAVEYPWAMAAVEYFAVTQAQANSNWVAGPYGVTADLRLPNCPQDPLTKAEPFPINPFPTDVPQSSDERPFYSYQSAHPGGAHFLFGDGSARFIQQSIDQGTLEALSTIAGIEPLILAD